MYQHELERSQIELNIDDTIGLEVKVIHERLLPFRISSSHRQVIAKDTVAKEEKLNILLGSSSVCLPLVNQDCLVLGLLAA